MNGKKVLEPRLLKDEDLSDGNSRINSIAISVEDRFIHKKVLDDYVTIVLNEKGRKNVLDEL